MVLGEFVRDLVAASMGGVGGGMAVARLAKVAVITLAVFMALDQLQIADEIVSTAFTLLLGALALAAGLAFGLGNRDLAGEYTRRWVEAGARKAREVRDSTTTVQIRDGSGRAPAGRGAQGREEIR
jgi:hypothetical protein